MIFTLAELHMRTHMAVYSKVTHLSNAEDVSEPAWDKDISTLEKRMIRELTSLGLVLDNSAYELRIANPFPRQTYTTILAKLGTLFRSLLLIAYSAQSFPSPDPTSIPSPWLQALRSHTQHQCPSDLEARFTSALAACGTALIRQQPLPPFIDVPDTSSLLQALSGSEVNLLDRQFRGEKGYEVLMTLHASGLLAAAEVRELVTLVGEVVGWLGSGLDRGAEGRDQERG